MSVKSKYISNIEKKKFILEKQRLELFQVIDKEFYLRHGFFLSDCETASKDVNNFLTSMSKIDKENPFKVLALLQWFIEIFLSKPFDDLITNRYH